LKKKTYVFDDTTLDMLDRLKCELNQKEVSILREAIKKLHDYYCEKQRTYESLREIIQKLDYIVNRIEDLSFQLGQCREKNRILEEKLREILEREGQDA